MALPVPVGVTKLSCFSAVSARHRLEQVRVVGGPMFDGPILHRLGDGVRRFMNRGVCLGEWFFAAL